MSDKIRIGVVGLRRGMSVANVAHRHPDVVVSAVCDLNADRAEEAAVKLGAKSFTKYEAMLESSVDAVIVATPPALHAELSIAAATSGVHVLSEVPAVASLEEAPLLHEKIKETGIHYMIAENVCYFDNMLAMQAVVDAGKVGSPYYAEGEYIHDCRELFTDRDDGLGGGVAGRGTWRVAMPPIHYCTHELGPLIMITGDPMCEAVALDTGAKVGNGLGAIDMEAALFRTRSGTVVKLLCGFAVAREPAHHFLSIYGTKGSVETDRYRYSENLKAYFEQDADSVLSDIPVEPRSEDAGREIMAGGHGTSEYYMVDDFVSRIRGPKAPADARQFLGIEDALNMTLPGICAHMSSERSGERVEVPVF